MEAAIGFASEDLSLDLEGLAERSISGLSPETAREERRRRKGRSVDLKWRGLTDADGVRVWAVWRPFALQFWYFCNLVL